MKKCKKKTSDTQRYDRLQVQNQFVKSCVKDLVTAREMVFILSKPDKYRSRFWRTKSPLEIAVGYSQNKGKVYLSFFRQQNGDTFLVSIFLGITMKGNISRTMSIFKIWFFFHSSLLYRGTEKLTGSSKAALDTTQLYLNRNNLVSWKFWSG